MKAKIHDLIFSLPPLKNIKNEEKRIFNNLLSKKHVTDKRILDIGCGTGDYTKQLDKNNKVFGVDITSNMLKKSRQKIPRGNFVQADSQNLPFKNSTIDFVSMIGLLEYFMDQSKPIQEASRVLKNEGTAIISFTKPSIFNIPRKVWRIKFHTSNDKEITEILKNSNLKIQEKAEGKIQTQLLCKKNL